MKQILIVSGHTDPADSAANTAILKSLKTRLPGAEVDELAALYPDFQIDIKAEQEKLEKADILVFQFPLFWYSLPSLLERWMEETFQHGFSHGSSGNKLRGKKLLLSVTVGAPESMYHRDGAMGYEIEEFFPAVYAMCRLTGMEYAGAVYTFGVSYTLRETPEGQREIEEKAAAHAERLVRRIEALL